jgi:hypothetical protein
MSNKTQKFNVAHFPKGTVCEITMIGRPPFEIEVQHIVQNGPNSFVLVSTTPGTVTEFESYNMVYVTRIIKRGTGKVVFDTEMQQRFDKRFMEDQKRNDGSFGIYKHHSQYLAFVGVRELVFHIADRYLDNTKLLDLPKLLQMLTDHNVLRVTPIPGDYGFDDGFGYYVVSKKKLNNAVRRMVNKCLVKRERAQREVDAELEQHAAIDLSDLFIMDDAVFNNINKERTVSFGIVQQETP